MLVTNYQTTPCNFLEQQNLDATNLDVVRLKCLNVFVSIIFPHRHVLLLYVMTACSLLCQ